MGISLKIGLVLTRTTPPSMRAFIVCLAIATVSGDAKPYTLAQVASGLPVQNAAADGRLHNVGYITNAAAAGVKTVGALAYTAPVHTYIHGFYGKREAEPYTLAQVWCLLWGCPMWLTMAILTYTVSTGREMPSPT